MIFEKNDRPKISIITVCYNSIANIEQAILSVISQSYGNLEYLIIDGGSTDGTQEIIEKYRSRIAFFISEKDKGISDAFNKGIKKCTGDLIGILNSDDFMMEDALTNVAQAYEEGIDVYRGNLLYLDEKTGSKFVLKPNMRFKLPPFFAKICHGASFITKDAYEKFGAYKVDFKYMMDLDLFVRLYYGKAKFKAINKTIFTFRVGGTSSCSEKLKSNERKRLILENGGSLFQAFIYVFYFRFKYTMKIFMDLLSPDFKFLLQYKKEIKRK